ncbi:hypothetical protein [Erwinia sp. CGal63]|uniref:hypothetical protein n=1 Tax=Erwinia sp. CGal63 TaxID=2919889 RepID=UPI0030085132
MSKRSPQQVIEAQKAQGLAVPGPLLKAEECAVPVFDTTMLHADMAVEFMLS